MNPARQRDLAKLLADAQLPALPQSAIEILELARNPENGPAEFALPIEADPGLTSQVLKFVNSSYFGFARKITSVRMALQLVGVRAIKNFVLWSAVFSMMPNPKCGPFDLSCLWQDSLRRGLAARSIARLLGLADGEEAFAAALLQDMAVPVLAKVLPVEYCQLLERRAGGRDRLSDLELAHFGWHHGNAGAAMAAHWNLPVEFAALIDAHSASDAKLASAARQPVLAAVQLSTLLPAAADDAWFEAPQFDESFQRLRGSAGPGTAEFLARVDAEFGEFAPVLSIAAPGRKLGQSFAAAMMTVAT